MLTALLLLLLVLAPVGTLLLGALALACLSVAARPIALGALRGGMLPALLGAGVMLLIGWSEPDLALPGLGNLAMLAAGALCGFAVGAIVALMRGVRA